MSDSPEREPTPGPRSRLPWRFDPWRLFGATLLSSLLGLIVYAGLSREAQPGDAFYLLVRWPVWLLAFVVAPLLAVRLTLWRAARRVPTPKDQPPRSE